MVVQAQHLEGGNNPQAFWKYSVEKEVAFRHAHNKHNNRQRRNLNMSGADGMRRSGSVPGLGTMPEEPSLVGSTLPEGSLHRDHGLIFCSLHDLHQRAVDRGKPQGGVAARAPARSLAPLAAIPRHDGSWFLPGSGRLPDDVASACTIASTGVSASVAGLEAGLTAGTRAGRGSAVSTAAPPPTQAESPSTSPHAHGGDSPSSLLRRQVPPPRSHLSMSSHTPTPPWAILEPMKLVGRRSFSSSRSSAVA